MGAILRRFFYIFKSKFKNMNWFLKVLLTAVAVLILAYVLPGVEVASYFSAIIVAIVLAILRLLVKPILVVLTFPITLITLGLFLLIINAIIILLADFLIDGFAVRNIWWALLFSVLLSFLQSILHSMLSKEN